MRFLLAVAFSCASFAGVASARPSETAPPPSPPLWRVADADSEIFLFGALAEPPRGAQWRSRALAAAIDKSETMWFEAPVDEPASQAAANMIFANEGKLASGRTLSALLSPEARAALEAAAGSSGIPLATLDALKPWAAFVLLSSRLSGGADAGETVDAAILSEARSRGRRLRYFGSVQDTLRVLTKMPEAAQIELLSALVADWRRQQDDAPAAFASWRAGDIAAVDAHLNAPLREAAPGVFERLVSARAETLAGGVADALKSEGTAFVSLNAGYLVGEGSIPERLAAMGLSVERVGAEAEN